MRYVGIRRTPTMFQGFGFQTGQPEEDKIMARQGNTPHSVTKHRETTADGRSFDKRKDVVAAPESKGAAAKARVAVHGPHANPKNDHAIGTDETPRASNSPHTPEYAGPGQVESDGRRVGNTPHTPQPTNKYPQRG